MDGYLWKSSSVLRPHSMILDYFPSVRVSFYQLSFCQLHMYWDFECNAVDFLQDYQSDFIFFNGDG